MYVFRELTDLSYPAIAREFGGRDHTTVIHAVEKISTQMRTQRPTYDQVTELMQTVRADARPEPGMGTTLRTTCGRAVERTLACGQPGRHGLSVPLASRALWDPGDDGRTPHPV